MRQLIKFSLITFLLLGFWACNDDEEQDDAPALKIKATLNLRNVNGTLSSQDWSLPDVSATRTNGNITVTAFNSLSGEIFSLRIPDDGAGYYGNIGSDNDFGFGSWRQNTTSLTWYSNDLPEGTPGNFGVDLVEINEANNTLSGTFFMQVFSPENQENAFFQNGSLTNVPIIIAEEDDEITENKVSFRVNGINFNPISIDVDEDENSTELIVSAINATDGQLIFSLPLDAVDSNQYGVGSGEGEINMTLQQPPFDPSIGISGDLVIESHNQGAKTMSGTFEFQAGQFGIANQTITDGVFEVIY